MSGSTLLNNNGTIRSAVTIGYDRPLIRGPSSRCGKIEVRRMTITNLTAQPVNVQELMRDIRGRLRSEGREHQFAREARKAVPAHLTSTIARLCAGTAALKSAVAAIGQPPPSPPTLRGRLGLLMVRLSQRSIFWLLPSLRTSQNQIVDTLEKHLQATEEILEALRQTHIELARLRALLQGQAPADAPPTGPVPAGGRR